MSCAIARSFRPLWRLRSYRPPPHSSIRRDRILALHGSAACYALRHPSEIVLYLRRYGRNDVAEWVNRRTSTPSEPSALGLSVANCFPEPWNLANAITAGRIAVTPLIGYWIISGQYNTALTGLACAGVSDALDGFVARRFKLRTVLGSYLDPLADKLLISTTTVCLSIKGIIHPGITALIIGRDLGLIGGWLWYAKNSDGTKHGSEVLGLTAIEPLFISKVNTTLQIAMGFTGVLYAAEWDCVTAKALQGIGYATAVTTIASGVSYLKVFWRIPQR